MTFRASAPWCSCSTTWCLVIRRKSRWVFSPLEGALQPAYCVCPAEHPLQLVAAVQGAPVLLPAPLAGRRPAHQFRCPLAEAPKTLRSRLRASGHWGLPEGGPPDGRGVRPEAGRAGRVTGHIRRPGAGGQVHPGYCVWWVESRFIHWTQKNRALVLVYSFAEEEFCKHC